MAHLFKTLLIVGGIFVFFTTNILAQGRDVTIFLKDSTQKKGELLIVRDSVIILLKTKVHNSRDIVKIPESIDFTFIDNINTVVLHEVKVNGAATGALVGAGLVGIKSVFSLQQAGGGIDGVILGMLGGAAAGSGIGWLVGIMRSEDEVTVQITPRGLYDIQQSARFGSSEPKYMREFINGLLKEVR
ncbi:MAG: hypothetical protein V4642_10505 [Bacteroidota bacterium]